MEAKCVISFWFCVVVSVFLHIPVTSKKFKRVVGGEPLLQRDPKIMPYDSVRWFAWIGDSGKACSHSWWSRLGKAVWEKHCPPVPSDLECGGALIAPFIIQTACHCISIWNFNDKVDYLIKKIPWLPATVLHYWEDRKDIYLGYNQVDKFEFYAFSSAFFVHQKCAEVTKGYAGLVTHDFGWIRLNRPVWDTDYTAPGIIIDYPPLYSEKILKEVTEEAVSTHAFCLVIGFGRNDRNVSSNVLKHAWNQIMDYQTCFRVAFSYRELDQGWGAENVTEGKSWACARPGLGKIGGRHNVGDSGGPITCNKHYIFVVSLSGYMDPNDEDFPAIGDVTWFMIESALIYAINENAFQYRQAFMDEVWRRDPQNPSLRIMENQRVVTASSKALSSTSPTAMPATASPFFKQSDLTSLLLLLFLFTSQKL